MLRRRPFGTSEGAISNMHLGLEMRKGPRPPPSMRFGLYGPTPTVLYHARTLLKLGHTITAIGPEGPEATAALTSLVLSKRDTQVVDTPEAMVPLVDAAVVPMRSALPFFAADRYVFVENMDGVTLADFRAIPPKPKVVFGFTYRRYDNANMWASVLLSAKDGNGIGRLETITISHLGGDVKPQREMADETLWYLRCNDDDKAGVDIRWETKGGGGLYVNAARFVGDKGILSVGEFRGHPGRVKVDMYTASDPRKKSVLSRDHDQLMDYSTDARANTYGEMVHDWGAGETTVFGVRYGSAVKGMHMKFPRVAATHGSANVLKALEACVLAVTHPVMPPLVAAHPSSTSLEEYIQVCEKNNIIL